MKELDAARASLSWASNRLTQAHQDTHLKPDEFNDALEVYLLATRAYHQTIRRANLTLYRSQAKSTPRHLAPGPKHKAGAL